MLYYRLLLILTILVLGALAGTACSSGPAAAPGAKMTPKATLAATTSPAQQPAMPAHATASPASSTASQNTDSASPDPAPTAGTVRTASGKVVETMDAGGSTYLRLDTGTDKIWVATSNFTVKKGDRLVVPLDMPMRNFRSARLGRDFPFIYFANSVSREGGTRAPASQGGDDAMPVPQGLPPGHPPIQDGASSAVTVTEVIRPPSGGYSVADLWARRAELAGRTITVRGKVVKFRGGILGRNWLHLQDGSGKAADGSNDITVTSTNEAAAGDIVTATGTLALDRDFGAGYRYGAIVEGATLSK